MTQIDVGCDYARWERISSNHAERQHRDRSRGIWNGNETYTNGWLDTEYSGSVVSYVSLPKTLEPMHSGLLSEHKAKHTQAKWPRNFTTATFPTASNATAKTVLDTDVILSQNRTFLLEFEVKGSQITSSFWLLDSDDEKSSLNPYATLSRTAPNEINGYFKLMGGLFGSNTNYSGQFRDLETIPVPEPSM